MKFVIFQSLVVAMVMASAPAAAGESTIAQTVSAAGATRVGQWGPRHEGRWIQGWRAPGGWGAYRPAVRGWVLPGYWMAPRYYIGNYTRYGWSTPPAGHGWSRYYDDAVLTDRDGRVYETVHNVDWDTYDQAESGAAQAAPAPRNAKGEVVGAVAGGASERRGERFLGERRKRNSGDEGRWSGTWRGRHNGGAEQVYEGNFEGEYRGSHAHWRGHDVAGYGPGPEIVTTTTHQPVTTTTVTETEEWVPEPGNR